MRPWLVLALLLGMGCRHVCTLPPTAPRPQANPERGPITVPLDEAAWLWA